MFLITAKINLKKKPASKDFERATIYCFINEFRSIIINHEKFLN
jgi:hypothetical protein